jgi:hypothetical protein
MAARLAVGLKWVVVRVIDSFMVMLLLMKSFSFLHELWSIAILLASSSRACEPVAILGEI